MSQHGKSRGARWNRSLTSSAALTKTTRHRRQCQLHPQISGPPSLGLALLPIQHCLSDAMKRAANPQHSRCYMVQLHISQASGALNPSFFSGPTPSQPSAETGWPAAKSAGLPAQLKALCKNAPVRAPPDGCRQRPVHVEAFATPTWGACCPQPRSLSE